MVFKRIISTVLLCYILILLSACDNKANTKIEVNINADINVYTPLMSFTPGIPLNVSIKPDIKKDSIKFNWTAEQGTFLLWKQENGEIKELGENTVNDNEKIYWSIDPNEKLEKKTFKIYLKLEDKVSSKVLTETSLTIEQGEHDFFYIKK